MHQLIFAKIVKKQVNLHYICAQCSRQFIDAYDLQGYSEEIKRECLEMYVNGLGFRAIERLKNVQTLADSLTLRYHTTVITWVKKAGKILRNSPANDEIPEVTQVDELETFVGKKNQIWLCTAVVGALSGDFRLGFGR